MHTDNQSNGTQESINVNTDAELEVSAIVNGNKPVDHPQRPDYIPESFWDDTKGEAKLEQLGKSYNSLRKAFNSKNNDKPGESIEDYMTPGFMEKNKGQAPEVLAMAFKAAKEAGLGVNEAHAFVEKMGSTIEEMKPPTFEEEMSSLGKEGPAIIKRLDLWIKGQERCGDIDNECAAALRSLGTTAAGIRALDVMRSQSMEIGIPVAKSVGPGAPMSKSDWYAATYETAGETGETREDYEARMKAVGVQLFGTGNKGFNGSGYGIK